jgi:hypothetical protein
MQKSCPENKALGSQYFGGQGCGFLGEKISSSLAQAETEGPRKLPGHRMLDKRPAEESLRENEITCSTRHSQQWSILQSEHFCYDISKTILPRHLGERGYPGIDQRAGSGLSASLGTTPVPFWQNE